MSTWELLTTVDWHVISCKATTLNLEANLTCCQTFRWRKYHDSSFIGVYAHRVWQLKQDQSSFSFRVLACPHWTFNKGMRHKDQVAATKPACSSRVAEKMDERPISYWCIRKRKKQLSPYQCSVPSSQPGPFKRPRVSIIDFGKPAPSRLCKCNYDERKLIVDYFRLHVDVQELYSRWNKKDKKFEKISSKLPGIRLLKQDPAETLITFLCSAENSASTVVKLMEEMCAKYGTKILRLDDVSLYDFPSLKRLSQPHVNRGLMDVGFGFRASFIEQCARQVMMKGGKKWLKSLKKLSYHAAVAELLKLHGVNMKVADLVCLTSLGMSQAVPIDQNVQKIAIRWYGYKENRALTNKTYEGIGAFFRKLWGCHAGWAYTVIHSAKSKPRPLSYAFSHATRMKQGRSKWR